MFEAVQIFKALTISCGKGKGDFFGKRKPEKKMTWTGDAKRGKSYFFRFAFCFGQATLKEEKVIFFRFAFCCNCLTTYFSQRMYSKGVWVSY